MQIYKNSSSEMQYCRCICYNVSYQPATSLAGRFKALCRRMRSNFMSFQKGKAIEVLIGLRKLEAR